MGLQHAMVDAYWVFCDGCGEMADNENHERRGLATTAAEDAGFIVREAKWLWCEVRRGIPPERPQGGGVVGGQLSFQAWRRSGGVREADVVARDVPLIVGLGGGVNSAAALAGLHRRGIRPDLISFADTKGEKPETYEAVEKLRAKLLEVGFPDITTVVNESPQAGHKSLEDQCLRLETMPSRAFGGSSCAMRWKVEPQEKFLNHWPPARAAWDAERKPIKVLGYDGGEERRASITEDSKLLYWYPLIEWGWDRARCISELEAAGWPVPPKSACFYCPSSTKEEVVWLAQNHPDLFARAVAMEKRALTSDRHELVTIKGLGRHWPWETLPGLPVNEFNALPSAPVESCIVCNDDGECETAPAAPHRPTPGRP